MELLGSAERIGAAHSDPSQFNYDSDVPDDDDADDDDSDESDDDDEAEPDGTAAGVSWNRLSTKPNITDGGEDTEAPGQSSRAHDQLVDIRNQLTIGSALSKGITLSKAQDALVAKNGGKRWSDLAIKVFEGVRDGQPWIRPRDPVAAAKQDTSLRLMSPEPFCTFQSV